MLTNFLFAILLIALTLGIIVSLDATTSFVAKLVKMILRFSRRSRLLTEYILRAYMRYRKTINKPLINNI